VEEIANQLNRIHDLLYYRFLEPLNNLHDDLRSIMDVLKELSDAIKELRR